MIRLRPSGVDEILIKRVQDWYEPGPGVFIQSLTASFSPAQLFTGTTTGVWYDPSDMTTLFQDAAGTTPVTAVEQPVGLMLDKRDTTYSTYFDGSVDYLSTPNSSSLLFGSGDFTVEAWVNPATTNHVAACIFTNAYTSGNVQLAISLTGASNNDPVGNYVRVGSFNGSWTESVSSNSLSTNTWSHIAVVRSGNNIYTFINGVLEATMPYSGSLPATTNEFLIGRRWDTYGTYPYLNGNISNLRIVKGTALYTANFTPPTSPLTAVAGTSLLTCGTTWSGNPAITTVGNTRADKLNPFKIGTGNHAFNSSGNSANFPVLSARYNLLTKTEDFSDAVWVKDKTTVNANTIETLDPFGGNNADKLSETTDNQKHWFFESVPNVSGATYTASFYVKGNGRDWCVISLYDGANDLGRFFQLTGNGAVGSRFGTNGTVTGSITNVGNGWYRCTIATTALASDGNAAVGPATGDGVNLYVGDTSKGLYVFGADLRVANDALNQPAYQRVNTSTDYDTVGFKPYLKFNGTNQWLQTNSIDFTSTAQMFVCAGVRKLSDATLQFPVELSSSVNTQNGSFAIVTSSAVPYKYAFASRGSITVDPYTNNSAYSAPVTNVLSGISDIDGAPDQAILRVNSTQAAISTADQGNVPYGTYPIYIGARAGSSLWFNGRLYQLVVAGKQASASEITNTETFINTKTGAF